MRLSGGQQSGRCDRFHSEAAVEGFDEWIAFLAETQRPKKYSSRFLRICKSLKHLSFRSEHRKASQPQLTTVVNAIEVAARVADQTTWADLPDFEAADADCAARPARPGVGPD